MKPGRRRLLIPGLLVALLVVVVVMSAVRRADAADKPVPYVKSTVASTIDDSRITESSGLAASQAHPGIAYTINDSGHAARVFAVEIETGEVVGTASVRNAQWRDTEAMALFDGKLWISDAGNNSASRTDFALYVMPEPGPGEHEADVVRYPVTFNGGPINIEAMAIVQGRVEFYNKGWPNGAAFVLPPVLSADTPNVAQPIAHLAPSFASDASATPDGKYVLIRTAASVEVHDAATWQLLRADAIPPDERGETITVESSGRSYLIGNEGRDSTLRRVDLSPDTFKPGATPIDVATQLETAHPVKTFVWAHRFQLAVAGGLGLLGVLALVLFWRRARRRRGAADPFGTM